MSSDLMLHPMPLRARGAGWRGERPRPPGTRLAMADELRARMARSFQIRLPAGASARAIPRPDGDDHDMGVVTDL